MMNLLHGMVLGGLFSLISLTGCVVNEGEGSSTAFLGLGMTGGGLPSPTRKSATRINTQILGAWIEQEEARATGGFGFGYRSSAILSMPPDCRIVFLIRNHAELERAIETTNSLISERKELCVMQD